jgi:cell division protein FtsL
MPAWVSAKIVTLRGEIADLEGEKTRVDTKAAGLEAEAKRLSAAAYDTRAKVTRLAEQIRARETEVLSLWSEVESTGRG